MITFRKPMLAAALMPPEVEHTNEEILNALKQLHYPVASTLKKDGIRALRLNGNLLSRTLKAIPNKSIRERSLKLPGGADMELWNPELVYDEIESIVMSQEHEDSDKIQFHILDWFNEHMYMSRILPAYEYYMRMLDGERYTQRFGDVFVELPAICHNAEELFHVFLKSEEMMGEGICFRTLNSPYKQGRSTLNEQYLVKLCRFVREEVTITAAVEQFENTNASRRNAVGSMDRSTNAANLVGKNTLGALICTRANGDTVRVGTGFNSALRQKIWDHWDDYKNKTIIIKYKPHGMKVKPRSPVYVGQRKDGQ